MALSSIQRPSGKVMLSLFVMLTSFAVAQAPAKIKSAAADGEIELVVSDPTGAVVSKAQVHVANQKGEQVAEGVTSDYGRFQFSGLAAENYTVTVLAPGFVANKQYVSVPQRGLIRIGTVLQIANKYTLVEVGGPNYPIVIDTIHRPYWDDSPFELYRRPRPVLLDVEILWPSHP
jgi:hypothetical protein